MSNELKRILKRIQFLTNKTIEEIAQDVSYSRAYLTSEVNKGENKEIKEKLLGYLKTIEQNVQSDSGNGHEANTINRKTDLGQGIGSIEERLLRVEAHLEVYRNAIAGLLSKEPSDFMKRTSEIQDQIAKAVNRRLDELRNK